MPFSAAISVNVHHIPRRKIHGTLQPEETLWVHTLIWMYVCRAQDEKTAVTETEEVHGCVVLLQQQQCILYMNFLMCNLEFQYLKTFNFYDGNEGE
jgi:hypothetical protein